MTTQSILSTSCLLYTSTLETAARTAKQYFLHCDNIVVTHDDENAFLLEVLYTIFNRETSENLSLIHISIAP